MKDEGFDTAFVRVSQIYAGVGTSLDDAHGFKGSQCFADSAAAGVEFLCEVSLRWKTFRRLIAALPDEREDFASGVRGGDLTGLFWTKLCEKLSLERNFSYAEEEVQRGADRGAAPSD